MPDDPYALLGAKIDVAPDVLRAKFRELGLSLHNNDQDTAHTAWEQKLRDGTLSERKIVGSP